MPTNADLRKSFEIHTHEDAAFQKAILLKHKEMTLRMDELPTKDEVAEIVEEVFRKILMEGGKKGYAGLLIIAGIVGALVVIGGGAKALLGWIGFQFIGK